MSQICVALAFALGAAQQDNVLKSEVTVAKLKGVWERDKDTQELTQFDLTLDTTTQVTVPARFGGGGQLTVTPFLRLKVEATITQPGAKKGKPFNHGEFVFPLEEWEDKPLTAGDREHPFTVDVKKVREAVKK